MNSALADALGAFAERRDGVLWAVPPDERGLAEVLMILRDRGSRLHVDARLSRERLDALGPIAVRSMTVEAGAGARLDALEEALRLKSLTLGPLPPIAWTWRVHEFVEGPLAGLRAIPGGRLEPLASQVHAMLADGRRFVSQEGPRAAAGPDLLGVVLGGEGRLALLTRARLRALRAPTHREVSEWEAGPRLAAQLREALVRGASPASVTLLHRGPRRVAQVAWQGSQGHVARERAVLERVLGPALATGVVPARPAPATTPWCEVSWRELEAWLAAEHDGELHRLSLTSVVALGEGLPSAIASSSWAVLEPVALALDPFGSLGGSP